MPGPRPIVPLALASSFLLYPGPSRAADDASLSLRWRAPSSCPSELEVRAEIERLVGRAVPVREASTLRAEAEISGAEGAWHVRLRTSVDGADGEKRLEASSCRSLADAVALVVALAYDPQAVASSGGNLQAPPAAPPAPNARRAPAARDGGEVGPPLNPSAHVAFAANAGALPAAAPGFLVGAGFVRANLRLEAFGSAWSEQSARLAPRASAPTPGGQFELWAMGGRACYGPEQRPVGLDLCTVGELGRLSGRGVGVTRVESGAFLWGALGAGVTVHWALSSHLGLRASAEGLVPLARPTFVLEPLGDVYRPAMVTGRAALGAEANF